MARKIPPDAFDFYFSLGPGRSYQAVAAKYGVTKRAVTDLAKREAWQKRIEDLHEKARQSATEKALESLEEMNERHLAALRIIELRALAALKGIPLNSALAAVRALDVAIRQERAIRGDSGEGGGASVEQIIRGEYAKWMTSGDAPAAVSMQIPGEDDDDAAPTAALE